MGATPTSLRQAPPRRFENYVLTRVTAAGAGLSNISDVIMTPIILGNVDDGSSAILDIGFDFNLDNIIYRRFFVNANGWMVLCGPTETSTATMQTELLNSSSYQNQGINLTNTSENVLLCPWFDDLRTVASDISNTPFALGTEKERRINEGLETPPIYYDQTSYGVKMYHDVHQRAGRRLIVRWACLSDYANASTVIRFEVVLYESGRIEFRYVPRRSLTLVETKSGGYYIEDATIGIFMPGTNRFRDFSLGLGHDDGARQRYIYGGAPYVSDYEDAGYDTFTNTYVSRPYTWRLRPATHWPGLDSVGSTFVFEPPVNRRRVLPRLEQGVIDSRLTLPTVARTGDSRLGNDLVNFDDRKTLFYVDTSVTGAVTGGTVVNYPTTLQRFYGDSEPAIVGRQDLFTGDFEVTGALARNAAEPFINIEPQRFIAPWAENKLFDNAPDAMLDPFFSGSSIDQLGDGLSQPLRAKTQIRFSLPIDNAVSMFGVSSSVYYYNRRVASWEVPQNSSTEIGVGASTMPAGSKGDIADPAVDSPNQRIIEDVRAFGPVGNTVSSGSHDKSGSGDQTDALIGAVYSPENMVTALARKYGKSVQNNEDYRATADELISLPINQPFLLEKAIVEVPFAFGDGWFQDRTTAMQPLETTTGSFDFGGPGITVALYNQYVFGNVTRRDLIFSGTLTHHDDNVAELVFSNFPPYDSTYQLRQRGFQAFGGTPSAVVTPITTSSGRLEFTGSVPLRCTALVSNGVTLRFTRLMNSVTTTVNRQGVLDLFNSPELTLEDQQTTNFIQRNRLAYIDNFGRGATGFDPSGRSIFGKEFTTSQALSAQGKVTNPFYLASGAGGITTDNLDSMMSLAGYDQFADVIASGTVFTAHTALPLESHLPSPYLIRPGDTLVLAVSKHRPVFYGTDTATPYTSGSVTHEVQLMTGAINLSFYGSLIKAGQEYHDTLNQPLASDAVHEIVVGADPVLDQFESDYRELYVSGTYDDYVVGALISQVSRADGRTVFVTGSVIGSTTAVNVLSRGTRGRVFSKDNDRSAPTPGTTDYDYSTSLSFKLQPYYEKAGTPRVASAVDSTERFWDSMMPGIDGCFKADGTGIALVDQFAGSFGNSKSVVSGNIGYIVFDYNLTSFAGGVDQIINGNWTWAYPFEPRYSQVSRQLDPSRAFIATYLLSASLTLSVIEPKPLVGFYFGPVLPGVFTWQADVDTGELNVNNMYPTSSAGLADAVKGLYGFGDETTVSFFGGTQQVGTNHFATPRQTHLEVSSVGSYYNLFRYGAIIRGWKYGVYSGLPTFTKAYFRQGRYGQVRDMLEQRPYTKFYQSSEKNKKLTNFRQGTTPAAVTVKFVDASGKLTKPENTWSQNLSFEATSSMPYFDGETRNRPSINTNTLNANIIAFNQNQFGQITL